MGNQDIDFVILWVDGNDPKWQAEKAKYSYTLQDDARPQRYRDWDNLQYWFRGVEKFAPWVNKIYFVTWGHIPKWLNINHPKLQIVKHSDYMPAKYLPTFNCNPLELNLHRIEGLSEQFVYFNDDMFLIAPTKKEDFFKNGKPCDSAALNVHCLDTNFGFNYCTFQAIGIINKYFNFHTCIRKNWKKWFNVKNGSGLLRTLYLLPCPRFPGIYQTHLANSYLKSTLIELWDKEYQLLDETSMHKFRNKLDYNQWIFRNWQLATGNFENRNTLKFGKAFFSKESEELIKKICDYIKHQKGKMLCINDNEYVEEELFKKDKRMVINAFNSILPQKSSYEL